MKKHLCIFCGSNKKKPPFRNYCSEECRDKHLAMKRKEIVNSVVKK